MNAATLYRQMKSHGLDVQALGENLHIQPRHKITEAMRRQIREMKAELLDFIYDYEERAAIMEFDGGMTRAEAETAAYNDLTKGMGS